MPRGGGTIGGTVGGRQWTMTWYSETYPFPKAWGSVIWTNPSSTDPLGCFRSGDVTDWVESDLTKLAIAIDTTGKLEGDNSAKLTATANSSTEYVEVLVPDQDYSDFDQLDIYVEASTTQTDLLIISLKNNGSWQEVARIEVAAADTPENFVLDLTGIDHDDVEGFRVTSNYDTAFTAYIDRIVFTSSKNTPFAEISWTVIQSPIGTTIQVDIVNATTLAVLKSNCTNGENIADDIPIDTDVKILATLISTVDGSNVEIDDVELGWIPDRIGDRQGEGVEI